MEIPPLRLPLLGNTLKKLRSRIAWYLREAAPLFLVGTLFLFFADKTGLLEKAREIASPVVVGFLGLPKRATDSMILGFLRRDYGAAGFFDMSRNGTLSAQQAVVALIVITLFMPCIAQFLVTIKERGFRIAAAIALFILTFSVGLGGLVHWILGTGVIHL
jgi:ferrous iron transport protein B